MSDLPARIKALAELEGPCPGCAEQGNCDPNTDCGCDLCGGTGRIVPFKALRVPCPSQWHKIVGEKYASCLYCEDNRGWVPEPEPARAKWLVFCALPDLIHLEVAHHPDDIFQVALAWAEEQQKEAQRG